VVARVAAHADKDGWRSLMDSLGRRIRRTLTGRPDGANGLPESMASIRARKLAERRGQDSA
jgi:hypothetical protein